jgi:phosphoglycolate phosphatase-like HAD superfamily hydrolase
MRLRTVYVDVDDTLVRTAGTKRIPMPSAIASVRVLHARGVDLYLWSSGGADYARRTAVEFGIEDCFLAFLPKPDAYIDDQEVHEWLYCRHVLPGNAGDIEA